MKMHLVKSTYRREYTGDVIIDLEKIQSINAAVENNVWMLGLVFDRAARSHVFAKFKTKEEMQAELCLILEKMGTDQAVAAAMSTEYLISDHDEDNDDDSEKDPSISACLHDLKRIKEMLAKE